MKKIQWGALLIILFLVAMVFTACANELGGNICTVTYLSRDGRTVLDTIQVEKGENAPYWEPLPEEGYEFVNWSHAAVSSEFNCAFLSIFYHLLLSLNTSKRRFCDIFFKI